MPDAHDQPPSERLDRWEDRDTHRVRVSERMLTELLAYGMTTTAGSSLVGPELLVLETVRDAEDAVGIPAERVGIDHGDGGWSSRVIMMAESGDANRLAVERDLAVRQAKLCEADLKVIRLALTENRPLEALPPTTEAVGFRATQR